jgi:Ca2+-transporting ATPase
VGDPVDVAVLRAAERAGIDRAEIVRERPVLGLVAFSTERKLMAAFHRASPQRTGKRASGTPVDATVVAYVKGAPRMILALSDWALEGDDERPLDEGWRRRLLDVNATLAGAGLGSWRSPSAPSRRRRNPRFVT